MKFLETTAVFFNQRSNVCYFSSVNAVAPFKKNVKDLNVLLYTRVVQ